MPQRLVVVIPTAGNCELLHRTLQSLADCDQPTIYDKTIVVENGPPGTACDVTESAPDSLRAEYVHIERANKSNALNQIFERFNEDDLIYLSDDDVRFASNVLTDVAKAADGRQSGFVYGGPLRIDSEGEPPAQWLDFLPGSMKGWEPSVSEFNPARNYFLGANWAVFAEDIRRAGGFDPRFGPGSPLGATGQEWNVQTALRRNGVQFRYIPSAIVWHHVDFSRFSPDFLLHRKFRGGLEAGIRAADHMHKSPRWHDYVRHPLLRARWRYFANRCASGLHRVCGSTMKSFTHQLQTEHARGFLHSYPLTMVELRETGSS